MFEPKYTITHELLENIKRVNQLIFELNARRFDKTVMVEFEREAREVSAHTSTSIEGNPLPLTEVKRILKNRPENIRDSEREVINYNFALEKLNEIPTESLQIDQSLILDIHRMVMDGLLPEHLCGKWRKDHVVVNDPKTGQVVYIPPDFSEVEILVADLVKFVTSCVNKIDPLILAGVVHKQMVIIHPFLDGNGRTTRLITKIMLAKMNLNTFNLFSFENYYNRNVTKYFGTVGEFGDYNEIKNKVDFTNWLIYFTGGIIDELLRVQDILLQENDTNGNNLNKEQKMILEYIKKNRSITDKQYAENTDRAKATRIWDFNKLIRMGLIERKGKGKNTFYALRE